MKKLEAGEKVLKGWLCLSCSRYLQVSWAELKNGVVVLCFTAYPMNTFHARPGFELSDDDSHSVLVTSDLTIWRTESATLSVKTSEYL